MATKRVSPKNPDQAEAPAEPTSKKAKSDKDTDPKAAAKKTSRKVGRAYAHSDRGLKDNVVVVRW